MVQVAISTQAGSVTPHPKHAPKLGSFIYILSAMAVISGFSFGYDAGIISEAILYVEKNRGMQPMNDIWKELIVSIIPGIAGIGALVAGTMSDIFGRKKVIMGASIIFTMGGAICAVAFNKPILFAGRVLHGFAIGLSSTIVPVYNSECAPQTIRGMIGTWFSIFFNVGILAANILAGAFSNIDPERIGWRLMLGFAAVPAVIQLIGFLFLTESPRYLYERFGPEASKEVLQRVYNGDEEWIEYELEEIKTAHEAQVKAKMEHAGSGFVFLRILGTPHVRKALLLGCALQAFQQLSGINTLMYYMGTIIKSAGIKDTYENIWISCAISVLNLLVSFFPVYMIERVGRRILLLGSMLGVLFSLCLLGGSFLLINKDSAAVHQIQGNVPNFDQSIDLFSQCNSYSNCDFCVTNEYCGFCVQQGNEKSWGYCLPGKNNQSDVRSDTGYCNSPTSSDTDNYHYNISIDGKPTRWEWDDSFCHTKYTFLPIAIIVIYQISFTSGFSPVPWVLNSEFYPLWARSTCAALSTFTSYMFSLLVSLTFLSLGEAITKYGAFFLYASITVVGLVIFYFFVPETKGLNLDEIEMLFMTKEEKYRLQENTKK